MIYVRTNISAREDQGARRHFNNAVIRARIHDTLVAPDMAQKQLLLSTHKGCHLLARILIRNEFYSPALNHSGSKPTTRSTVDRAFRFQKSVDKYVNTVEGEEENYQVKRENFVSFFFLFFIKIIKGRKFQWTVSDVN